ncbi:MAG: c-type cytochrome biogenesis protein CcmI/CycH [Thermoanaerobaculia bacterium]
MSTENNPSRFSSKSAFALGAGSALVVAALAVFAVRHDGRAEAAVNPAPVQTEAVSTTVPMPAEPAAPATGSEPKMIPGHQQMPHPTMPAVDAPSVLSGTIALDDSIARSVSGKVIVFVIARSGAGKGHPVFAKRLDVTSFPVPFSLSAADSMMGQAPPDHVALEARIDTDGDAMTHEANAPSVKLESVAIGTSNIKLVLKSGV